MIDPVSISLAVGGIIISIVAYIKHSSCCHGAIEFDTRTGPLTQPLLKK